MNGAGLVQEAATDAYNGDADGYGHRCPAPTKDAAVEEQTEPVDFSCWDRRGRLPAPAAPLPGRGRPPPAPPAAPAAPAAPPQPPPPPLPLPPLQ